MEGGCRAWTLILLVSVGLCAGRNPHKKHAVHVQRLLERLRIHNLFLKPLKCHFFQKEVEFLGMHISGEGMRIDYSEVKGILE